MRTVERSARRRAETSRRGGAIASPAATLANCLLGGASQVFPTDLIETQSSPPFVARMCGLAENGATTASLELRRLFRPIFHLFTGMDREQPIANLRLQMLRRAGLKSVVQARFSARRLEDRMRFATRFAVAALTVVALTSAYAQESGRPPRSSAPPLRASAPHLCLDQKERRAVAESGEVVRLAAAIRAAKSRMPGTVVRARLCRGREGLVYVLTVLARDGKVARLTVDAVKGTVVGGI